MTVSKALFTSDKSDWCTPPEILEYVYRFFPGGIRLDPCSNSDSLVVANFSMDGSPDKDGLEADWVEFFDGYIFDRSGVFVNPPYGKTTMPLWVEKIAKEARCGEIDIVALIPARTSNKWWMTVADTQRVTCFIQQRVTFVGAKSGAPFPSAMVYWGQRWEEFCDVFAPLGALYNREYSCSQRAEKRLRKRAEKRLRGLDL